jgi:peptide-methionine (S)-S-oxide reductase
MRQVLFALLCFTITACSAPPRLATAATPAVSGPTQQAIFAGGCFWCAEHDLEAIPGVVSVVSGYTGGDLPAPTYENHEGHVEAVRVVFDPEQVSYRELIDAYWRLVDPTDAGGQFCDRGTAYETAVFVAPAQRADAEASKIAAAKALGRPIVTPIRDISAFTLAEDYHQDFAKKNPVRYRFYRNGCGRDQRLRQVWGVSPKDNKRE